MESSLFIFTVYDFKNNNNYYDYDNKCMYVNYVCIYIKGLIRYKVYHHSVRENNMQSWKLCFAPHYCTNQKN